jgi:two-component system, LuxR family, response regulator FixJ
MPSKSVIHVIDDDEAVRQSLEFLLASADLHARTYDSAKTFLARSGEIESGCVITDVRMPGMTGIQLLQHLQEMQAALPVIVITGHGDVPLAVEAIRSGAVDFLEKPFDDETLLTAVRAALEAKGENDGREAERREFARRILALSGRERQVLDELVAGNPNKIIAFDLGISPRTVEIYRANLMTKMQAASLSELVRMALLADGEVDGR